jgi:phosphatidylglycerophosphatase A
MRNLTERVAVCVATGLYSGFFPIVAGTVGTIPAWLIAYFVLRGDQSLIISAAVVFSVLSVWSGTTCERLWGHDPKKIVMDEWAGMLVAVIALPHTLSAYIIAFFAFRFFDVVKVPPAAQAERLRGGWGITMDDIIAGAYANLFTRLVLYAMEHWWPELAGIN